MKLLRSFPALAFALVLLSIAGLCAAQHSLQLLLVAGTLAAMSWYVTEGPRGRTLPRWVSNILVIAVSLNVFVDLFQHQSEVMGVLGRFAVWLMLIKLYERRTARDHAQLLTLSLLLMMTGCLQSNELLFGVILAVYAALGLYVLLLYQLHVSYERSRNARQESIPKDYRLVPPFKPIMGRHADLHFRMQVVGVGVAGVALSILVFVTFPRQVGADMLGIRRDLPRHSVGQFAWNIDLNAGGRITDSRVRLFSLQLTDADGEPIRLAEPLRLRGAALERYEGHGRWKPLPGRVKPISPSSSQFVPLADGIDDIDQLMTQEFIVNRANAGTVPVFSVYAPVAVAAEDGVKLQYDPARQTLKTDESSKRLLSYRVQAHLQPTDAMLDELTHHVPPTARVTWFSEQDNRQLRALAESILAQAGVSGSSGTWLWNHQAARALTAYLQFGGNFTYTTDLSSVVYSDADEDPIVRFLSNTRRGHCEFFASGLAALCNSIGIPTRVVVGYIAYAYDETNQQYHVLAANSHAWVEVAVGERRWITLDPTPPATLNALHRADNTFTDRLRWAYESIDSDWTHTIAGFDGAAQTQLADSFNKTWLRRFAAGWDAVRGWMEQVNQAFHLGPAGYIWMGIVVLALVIAVIALAKLMRRSLVMRRTLHLQRVRGSEYQRMLRQLGFYLDMLTVLKRGGLIKPLWQPPLAFAQAVSALTPRTAALVRSITDVFYAARYGRHSLTRDQIERARRMIDELAAELKVKR